MFKMIKLAPLQHELLLNRSLKVDHHLVIDLAAQDVIEIIGRDAIGGIIIVIIIDVMKAIVQNVLAILVHYVKQNLTSVAQRPVRNAPTVMNNVENTLLNRRIMDLLAAIFPNPRSRLSLILKPL